MKSLLLLVFSLYLLLLGYVYLAQRSFIYFPEFTRPATVPSTYQLNNDGLLLKGWVLNEDSQDAVIYFGGNGESLEYNLPQFRQTFQGKAVYMVSYRGYGDSEGEPSESGIYSDALALYNQVQAKHASISIIGRSLGSGVATFVAASKSIDKLVLITPFSSIEDLARGQFPILPVGLLLQDKYRSDQRVKDIQARSLILYAAKDRVVPEASTKKLIAQFNPDRLEVKKIAQAGHNSISDFPEYQLELQVFFSKSD